MYALWLPPGQNMPRSRSTLGALCALCLVLLQGASSQILPTSGRGGQIQAVTQRSLQLALGSCDSLLTAASASSTVAVGAEDIFLVQPSTSNSSYPASSRALWTFHTNSTELYGIALELLELQSERALDSLVVVGRSARSAATSSVIMSGNSPSFTERIYQSGVSLLWMSDGSVDTGVGFRVRVSRVRIPGAFRSKAVSRPTVASFEYVKTNHIRDNNVVNVTVLDDYEIVFRMDTFTKTLYDDHINVTWILSPQHFSQTLKLDVLDMDIRSTDTVTLSASGWSLVLSGDIVPIVSTYVVRGPLTLNVATLPGDEQGRGNMDIRVYNSNEQPTVGVGAVAPAEDTCGGTSPLPPLQPDSTSTPNDSLASSTEPTAPSTDTGSIIGAIFPIFIVLGVASVAYRYHKQRKARQRAATTSAAVSASPLNDSSSKATVKSSSSDHPNAATKSAMDVASPHSVAPSLGSDEEDVRNPSARGDSTAAADVHAVLLDAEGTGYLAAADALLSKASDSPGTTALDPYTPAYPKADAHSAEHSTLLYDNPHHSPPSGGAAYSSA